MATHPAYRVFYAHPKGMADAALAADALLLCEHLSAIIGDTRTVEVTTGFADWGKHFRRCGSWENWTRDVAVGQGYGASEPRYHAFVLGLTPGEIDGWVVGTATRKLADLAIGARKPVLGIAPRKRGEPLTVFRVAAVETIASASFTENGRVILVDGGQRPRQEAADT